MKKIVFAFAFLTIVFSANAQFGVGFYPMSNIINVRWQPLAKIKPDSTHGIRYETSFKYHVELRSTFSYTFYHRLPTTQPELVSFYRVAGDGKNQPGLMTGLGFYYHYSSSSSGGVFFPFLIEYAPRFKGENHLVLDAEMDLMLKLSGTPKLTTRPLIGVSWLFDSRKVMATKMMKRH